MGIEKDIENSIISYIRMNGWYCQKVHSGSLFKQGKDIMYKIKLADEGTPDILSSINGKFIGIEIKKDQKEIERGDRVVERFIKKGKYPKSNHREVMQHLEAVKILKAGGIVLTVSSITQLIDDLKELKII